MWICTKQRFGYTIYLIITKSTDYFCNICPDCLVYIVFFLFFIILKSLLAGFSELITSLIISNCWKLYDLSAVSASAVLIICSRCFSCLYKRQFFFWVFGWYKKCCVKMLFDLILIFYFIDTSVIVSCTLLEII